MDPVQLRPATAAQIPAIALCAARAFRDDALEKTIFAGGADADDTVNTPNVAFRIQRIRASLPAPAWRYVVATTSSKGDTADPRVVGFSAWTVPQQDDTNASASHPPSTTSLDRDPDLPSGIDLQAAQYAMTAVDEAKKAVLGAEASRVWYLSSLAVDPDFQGRGIASRLVQWGLDQADEAGCAAYLESSPAAVGVYRRLGFQELGRLCIIKDHPSHVVTLMKRAPSASVDQ